MKKVLSSGVVLCAGLALSLADVAQAQPYFQTTFPGTTANDAARGGVLITQDGGTISVGESQSFTKGQYDVYIVKTDACGFQEWATTYDFGGNDYGRKIRQNPDGSYIVVGSTENHNSCCNNEISIKNGERDIFLLHIDAKGGMIWSKTYGGIHQDDGNDVQLYFDEGYVVAGTTNSFGDGKFNGYLMRTDLNGNVLWGRSYGQRDGAEEFNSCTITAKGDILAVGSTYSYGNQNIFAVKTDPNGIFDIPGRWGQFYPEATGAARHVISCSDGTYVIAGWVISGTDSRDGYLLRIDEDGNPQFDQAYAEAYKKFDDEIAEVRETFDGNLVFTGYMTNAPGGFGGRDLWLGGVDYKFNTQWHSLHGEKLDDEGYSIAFDPKFSEKYGSVYVTANGVTQNFVKAGEDLYLVSAIKNGYTGCYDTNPKVTDYRPNLQPKFITFCHPLAQVQCNAKASSIYVKGQNLLCTWCKFLRQEEGGAPSLGRLDGTLPSGLSNETVSVGTADVTVKGRTGTDATIKTERIER